jgi:hypothetical protein
LRNGPARLDAYRATQVGEVVAEIGDLNGTKLIVCREEGILARLPKGTKLYTHPSSPAGDWRPPEGFALVERSIVPVTATEAGGRLLAMCRRLNMTDEQAAVAVFTDMLLKADVSAPQPPGQEKDK